MINKQSLWFLTLFSLILVLSVYYITMPNELLLTNNNSLGTTSVNSETTSSDSNTNNTTVTIEESETLVTMRVNLEEEREEMMNELKTTLTSEVATAVEKNDAYEQMKVISELKAKESSIERQIKDNFSLDSFVKIDGTGVKVVVVKKDHDSNLANQIMKKVQENFNEKVQVTVKFEQ